MWMSSSTLVLCWLAGVLRVTLAVPGLVGGLWSASVGPAVVAGGLGLAGVGLAVVGKWL